MKPSLFGISIAGGRKGCAQSRLSGGKEEDGVYWFILSVSTAFTPSSGALHHTKCTDVVLDAA